MQEEGILASALQTLTKLSASKPPQLGGLGTSLSDGYQTSDGLNKSVVVVGTQFTKTPEIVKFGEVHPQSIPSLGSGNVSIEGQTTPIRLFSER